MADDVRQVFTLDASDYLQVLKQVDTDTKNFYKTLADASSHFGKFNRSAGASQRQLNKLAASFTAVNQAMSAGGSGAGINSQQAQAAAQLAAGLNNTASAAQNAAVGLKNVGAAGAGLDKSNRMVNNFAVSLETLTRVVSTQLIVRSLNAIRSAVEGSFQGFLDFNRELALIKTLDTTPLEQLSASLRQVSDDFNVPLLDVVSAKFNILQNDFQATADSNNVLSASLKFSKIAFADANTSVDAITSVLQAFGKSAGEAEIVAARLFKTVERGRLVGSELAQAIGRVAPVAAELGIEFEELLAGFTSITIGGAKLSEAATQIRASMTAILKPSDDMKKAFRALGVETGDQLIASKGYIGAMQAVIATTDGSSASIAKLFPNVRALTGILRNVGTGADFYTKSLEEIRNANAALLNQKFDEFQDNPANRLAADINKVKNFFTADIGKRLTETTAQMFNFAGGADTAIAAMSAFLPVAGLGVAALIGYSGALAVATGAQRAFTAAQAGTLTTSKALGGALAGLIAAYAAYAAGTFIGGRIGDSLTEDFRNAIDLIKRQTEFEKSQVDARVDLANQEVRLKAQIIQNAVVQLRAAYFAQVDAAKEANEAQISNDRSTMNRIIQGRQKFAEDLKREAQRAGQDVIASEDRVTDLRSRLEDTQFDRQNRRFNDRARAFQEAQRAEELAAKASDQLATANTAQEQKVADSTFQRAEAYARQAIESAKTLGNTGLQRQAEEKLEAIIERRIAAEETFQKNRAAAQKELEKAAASEEARVARLKAAAKTFLDKSSLFDDSGELLSPEEIDKNTREAKAALKSFAKDAFAGADFNIGDLLAIDTLRSRIQTSVSNTEIAALAASPAALDGLVNTVQGAFDSTEILVKLAPDPSALQGLPASQQFNEVQEQLKDQEATMQNLKVTEGERAKQSLEINRLQKIAETSFQNQLSIAERLSQSVSNIGRGVASTSQPVQAATQDLEALRVKIQEAFASGNFSPEVLQRFAEEFNRLGDTSIDLGGINQGEIARARVEFEAFKQAVQTFQQQQATADAPAQLQAETAKRDASLVAAQALAASATASQSVKDNSAAAATSLNTQVSAARQIAAALEQAAAAQAKIGQGGAPAAKAFGGRMLAAGGRGTDTVPAMLTPGEMVINSKSSSRFFSELQAINAGIRPTFRSEGGSVSVGDITVNVNSQAAGGKASGTKIAAEVERAIRRGAARKFK